ncbi:MAG: P-loop NTPase fold protein [Marinirhabdus sp.]|nr:P-loop NTPase fold protein [Marinirhabdus sp.]
MTNYFNDSPIETKKDDRYGVTSFSESLAKCFVKIEKPVGTTIALHGPWGAGKSSVVNLVRQILSEGNNDGLVVSEFKCWWYKGEEALALAFLQNLNAILRTELKDKVKDLIPKLGRGLLQAGPVIGSAIALSPVGAFGGLIGGAFDFSKRFFPEGETSESVFKKLSDALEKEERRFLIIIDDIDRLEPEEALAIFRLVKSVGRLPNVMYLLVFDRNLAERIVQEKYPSEGPHFLEKIIQAGFELPPPLMADLNEAVLASIYEICGVPKDDEIVRFMNIFYDVVAPYITSPRHVSRLKNAISVTWPAITGEVDVSDFVALETLRLYEPVLFNSIKANKNRVCGIRQEGDLAQNDERRFDILLTGVQNEHHELAKIALQRLFPRLESMGYGGEWTSGWSAERRVCIETHFDTYFRLSLSDQTLPSRIIEELIVHADDSEFIKSTFRQAATVERRNGSSMVPVYLDELTTNAKKVPNDKVMPLLSALFEIHDEINLERDAEKGFMSVGNTTFRYHWLIRRLTRDRFSIVDRTAVYLTALRNSSLGWLVDFTSSAASDYQERENRPQTREEDCLVLKDALPEITAHALAAIRSAADSGTLVFCKDLLFILYRWKEFSANDLSEVRAWTDRIISDPKLLVILVRAMTSDSWSMGMGGFGSIGDRVAKRSVRAQISDDTDIVDVNAFRHAIVNAISSDDLQQIDKEALQQFLTAWDGQNEGRR